ncbi:MAG: hypothetical protein P4L51_04525 [Puia sp.]|nr:hypothetical protein [Puia sp.]
MKKEERIRTQDFVRVLRRHRVFVGEGELAALVARFDPRRADSFDYLKFFEELKGPLPIKRKELIEATFEKLSAPVSLGKLKSLFVPQMVPSVEAEKTTPDEALSTFCDTLDLHARLFFDPATLISREQFVDYFHYLSLTVGAEDEFTQIMTECWEFPDDPATAAKLQTNPTHIVVPPFDVSAEPTQYLTTTEFMRVPKPTPPIPRSERGLLEQIREGLRVGGLRKVFGFLRGLFRETGTIVDAKTGRRRVTLAAFHTLLHEMDIMLTPMESEKTFEIFDSESQGWVNDARLISGPIIVSCCCGILIGNNGIPEEKAGTDDILSAGSRKGRTDRREDVKKSVHCIAGAGGGQKAQDRARSEAGI